MINQEEQQKDELKLIKNKEVNVALNTKSVDVLRIVFFSSWPKSVINSQSKVVFEYCGHNYVQNGGQLTAATHTATLRGSVFDCYCLLNYLIIELILFNQGSSWIRRF